MTKFQEPLAQAEYERLIASGVDDGDAHEEVERRKLNGEFIPQELRLRPRVFAIVGSDDQKRIARLKAVEHMSVHDPEKFDQYKRQANAAGVSITGKGYNSGLAAYPGDPDAWVKDDNDIKAVARMKGIHVGKEEGILKLTVPIDPTQTTYRQGLKRKRNYKPVVKQRRNNKG